MKYSGPSFKGENHHENIDEIDEKNSRNDPRVDEADIRVEVTDGYATLRGTVDDLEEKRAAAKKQFRLPIEISVQ